MPTQALLPESFGRYRILKKLGEGGMGAVYLAEDALLGRQIALKVPHFSADDGPAVIERFYREARAAAQLTHPDVCPVLDVGQVNGIHFLTMPFIEGEALSRYLGADRPWPPARACALMRRLAVAVGVLHQRGMVHRDLKPGNVMVRPGGEPMLMDFGLARSFTSQSKRLTSTGAALGTPAYMAPEQVLGESDSLGPPTDLYALGVILFEMLTGHLPFEGPPMAVFGQILHAEPPLASSLLPGLDRRLDALCRRAMAKKQTERFASAAAFAAALEAFTLPVLVADETPVARAVPAALPVPVAVPARTAPSTPLPPPTSPRSTSFPCPQCRKKVRVPPEMTGRKVRCAHCGASLGVIPALADTHRTVQPTEPSAPQRETARLPEVTLADPPPPRSADKALLWLSLGAGAVLLLLLVALMADISGR